MKKPRHTDILNQASNSNLLNTSGRSYKKSISCHRMDCLFKVVCRCTECSFYYCYEHVQVHPHSREKLELVEGQELN